MPDVVFKNPFSGITSTGNVMNEHKAGAHSTGPYLKSGIPYVTTVERNGGASAAHTFPSVAKDITIVGLTNDMQVCGVFADIAANGYVTLNAGQAGVIPDSPSTNWHTANGVLKLKGRFSSIWLRSPVGDASVVIFAELTGIPPQTCPAWAWATGTGTAGEALNTANSEADNNARIP